MARATKKPPLIDTEPRCGSCRFWRRYEGSDVGACRLNPPQSTYDPDTGDETVSWPTVEATEFACGQFKGKH